MSTVAVDLPPATQDTGSARDLALILLLALALRLVFSNGAFGSDDLTYFDRAAALARGEWTSANYNGALRYGFNLPAAGFMAIFGDNLFVANFWPLTCSLIEIGAVFLFASAAMGGRSGIFAALLLATAPLHIAVATRIHADPVVSMFLTLGFVLLYFGAIHKSVKFLFAAGLSIGGVFWTKELAAVTWVAFLPMLWLLRSQWRNCIYVVAGTLLMLVAHGILMFIIAGDPLHLVKVVTAALKRNFIVGGEGKDAASYYLRYLFIDLRHVGMLALFATLSIYMYWRLMKAKRQVALGIVFTLIWLFGLIAVLSVFPVSLFPLRFTMKQSNYISLFLAPLALLAGSAVAALPKMFGRTTLLFGMVFGIFFGALQQADYRAFTANSKAVAEFAIQHPRDLIVGTTNNSSLGSLWANQTYPGLPRAPIISFRDLNEQAEDTRRQLTHTNEIFAVIDRQTMLWAARNTSIANPLDCWQHVQVLRPTDLALGNALAKFLGKTFDFKEPLASALNHLATPMSAEIYRVTGKNVLCR